jgi:DnaJ-domain-containing protein 1
VSISKRLLKLVRSNITTLLERSQSKGSGSVRIEELSDAELEAELVRRRLRREAAERAAADSYTKEAWEEVEQAVKNGTGRYRTTGRRSTGTYRRATGFGAGGRRTSTSTSQTRDPRLAQLYAQLECPYGADLTAVRKAYRAMMRKYHPDMHSGNPDKQRVATELSQRLTMAYNELRRHLSS